MNRIDRCVIVHYAFTRQTDQRHHYFGSTADRLAFQAAHPSVGDLFWRTTSYQGEHIETLRAGLRENLAHTRSLYNSTHEPSRKAQLAGNIAHREAVLADLDRAIEVATAALAERQALS